MKNCHSSRIWKRPNRAMLNTYTCIYMPDIHLAPIIIWATLQENGPLEKCSQQKIRLTCIFLQSDQSSLTPWGIYRTLVSCTNQNKDWWCCTDRQMQLKFAKPHMHRTTKRTFKTCAPSKDLDQPAHLHSLICFIGNPMFSMRLVNTQSLADLSLLFAMCLFL